MNKFYFARYKSVIISFGICLSCLFLGNTAKAQVAVFPNQTATALAQKLVGTGVTVLNPAITCKDSANGIFVVTASNLGLDSGIVLTSGKARSLYQSCGSSSYDPTLVGVNIINGGTAGELCNFASTANNFPGDPQLTALAGQPTHDACILQFDFRPQGDTIKFQYVFGSEEYTDYTCSEFNDVFGFFISGPGITGAPNIALIPGTNIQVCINSVNCSTGQPCTALVGPGSPYCSYYVNNFNGTTMTYDGLTTVLTAIAAVTPCDTYHLKLGVADGTDMALDSGVFIKAGSLSSTGISIVPNGAGGTNSVTQNAIRGCNPGNFVFNIAAPMANPFTIHYVITGTAINGYDYVTIPDSIVIPANSLSATQIITPLGVPPTGPKSVTLEILSPYTCNGVQVFADSSTLMIYDSLKVSVNPYPDTAICLGQSVQIHTNGDSLLSYSWSPAVGLSSDTASNPLATPQTTTTYSVTTSTSSLISCVPAGAALTITVYQPPVVNAAPNMVTTCLGTPVQLNSVATPATQPYTYSWLSTTGLSDPTIPNPIANPSSDITYTITVSPPVAGCSGSDTVHVRVLPNDFDLLTPDTTVCRGGSVPIRAAGDTDFTYTWTPAQYVSNVSVINPIITPDATGNFIYTITATYPNCPNMAHSIDITVQQSIVNLITRDTSMCLLDPMQLLVADSSTTVTYTWSPGEFLSDSTIKEPEFFTQTAGSYTYTLTEETPIGCLSSDSVTLTVRPAVQIQASPTDTTIAYGGQAQLNAWNLRPEPLYYFWTPENATLNNPNINNPIATPTDPTTYEVVGQNEWGCRDSASVQVNIDFAMTEFIPSAFSPNGDGRNDVFRILNMKYQKLLDFRVYNRWGKQIFQTADVNKGWDGTCNGVPQDIGVYNYIIIIARPDGTEKTYTGTVTLVR